jgi:TonB family protein
MGSMTQDLRRWTSFLLVLFPLFAVAQFRQKSAGAAIEDAAHEAATKQANPQTAEKPKSITGVTVLTDTKGFNTQFYVDAITRRIRDSWYAAIRELVNKPDQRNGKLTIGFTIVRSGEVQGAHVVDTSGEQDLDEAALQGLLRASPLPPLPKALPPDDLKLVIHFYYKGEKPSKWWRQK